MMGFVLKMMKFVLKMMGFVFKMMDLVFKMMNFALKVMKLMQMHRETWWPEYVLRCCLLCIYMPALDRRLSDCRYDKPLGKPKGPYKRDGYKFSREFEHLSVALDCDGFATTFDWH